MLRSYLMLAPALAVVLLLFGGGLLLAVLQSVGYWPLIGPSHFTLEAYRQLLHEAAFYRSLLLSLWIATVSTATATVLATLGALSLRRHFRAKPVVTFLFQLNIPIPHLVGAVGILFLFAQSGFLARLAAAFGLIQTPAQFPALIYDRYGIGIILEYVWKSTCFIGLILLAVLQSLGDEYDHAARTLGANRWQRFRYITLPFLLPGILSASVLVFAFTFGAFEVPLLLGQRYPSALPVLAYRAYTNTDLNGRPEAMALSIIISVIITFLIFVYVRWAQITIHR